MPLILAFRRQRQVDLSEFKASLVYKKLQNNQNYYTEKPCNPVTRQGMKVINTRIGKSGGGSTHL